MGSGLPKICQTIRPVHPWSSELWSPTSPKNKRETKAPRLAVSECRALTLRNDASAQKLRYRSVARPPEYSVPL